MTKIEQNQYSEANYLNQLVDEIFTNDEPGNSTSSIGPTFPPRISSFGRIKGFENRAVIDSREQITEYVEMIELIKSRLDGNISRVSFRFLAENSTIADSLDLLARYGEVVIPLYGAGDGFDYTSMVYLGYNLPNYRDSDSYDRQLILNNISQSLTAETRSYDEIIGRIYENGYSISSPDIYQRMSDENFRTQMINLYSRFGWSAEDVVSILENPRSIFAVISKGNTIVSAGLAERAEITIGQSPNEKTLRLVELTEAATLEEYQGQGLYTGVAAELLRIIADLPEDERVHIALGECNGLAVGVLKAAKRLGRTLSHEVISYNNLPIDGFLPQHVAIDGPARNTSMNDLVPAYILANNIKMLYGDR